MSQLDLYEEYFPTYLDIVLRNRHPLEYNSRITIRGYRRETGWYGRRFVPSTETICHLWPDGFAPAVDIFWPDQCYELIKTIGEHQEILPLHRAELLTVLQLRIKCLS